MPTVSPEAIQAKSLAARGHIRFLIILSSCATLLTIFLTTLSSQLPLFDSSPHILLPPTPYFSLRRALASAALRWDVFYFAPIAKDGYVYEQQWAFFPGVPRVMRTWAVFMDAVRNLGQDRPKSSFLEWEDILLGGLTSSLLSIPSVLVLYDLTLTHLGSRSIALLASLLSLLPSSPTTLRMAGYSEPFFTFLSYMGMRFCAHRQWFLATCCFAAATTFRSNGILLAGFILWGLVVEPLLAHRKVHIGRVLYALALCTFAVAFFFYYQYHAYRLFCEGTDTLAPWCSAFPPSIYTYVQGKYWNVGLLRYWTLQQIPNFLLGAPPLLLLLTFATHYIRLALGPRLVAFAYGRATARRSPDDHTSRSPFLSPTIAPHVIHALVLCFILIFASHTQIVLRFAAAMPLTYWAAAWLVVERPKWARWWIGWSVLWGATSCVLWGVFLPPA
ncbi:glycosyltransferase family 76 protein [Cubamyces lactineus]|nr:glycosyltransferase family 76 protein [Cubamyces lactineus]